MMFLLQVPCDLKNRGEKQLLVGFLKERPKSMKDIYLVTNFTRKVLNHNVHFMCSFLSEVLLPTDFLRYAHMYARATLVK